MKRTRLTTTSALPRTGRLRARSRKQTAAYVPRRALVAAMLEEHPICARCQAARAVDVHELKNRSQGGDMLDPDQCVTLCRDCHDWATQNPAAAHAEGWTVRSYEPIPGTAT